MPRVFFIFSMLVSWSSTGVEHFLLDKKIVLRFIPCLVWQKSTAWLSHIVRDANGIVWNSAVIITTFDVISTKICVFLPGCSQTSSFLGIKKLLSRSNVKLLILRISDDFDTWMLKFKSMTVSGHISYDLDTFWQELFQNLDIPEKFYLKWDKFGQFCAWTLRWFGQHAAYSCCSWLFRSHVTSWASDTIPFLASCWQRLYDKDKSMQQQPSRM